jgi:hypothetical protein
LNFEILGLGHPRTGTGYTSAILQSWGLGIGHEQMGEAGMVAWQLIHPLGPYPYMKKCIQPEELLSKYKHLIYNVRNPADTIPSVVYTEVKSLNYRSQMFGFEPRENLIEQAIESIVNYDALVSKLVPDVTYRIEYDTVHLYTYLKKFYKLIEYTSPITKKVNARAHSDLESLKFYVQTCSSEHKDSIDNYSKKHGYPSIFKRT